MNCIGCKFYDSSVDACNADENCYQQGRADAIEELSRIENYCDNCYMEFCESCSHNGEYAFAIQRKIEQLKEQPNVF